MSPAPTDLLPHTGTARLLTDIVRNDSDSIEAIGQVLAAHPLVTDGRAPCFIGLELGAQATAALEAILRAGPAEAGRYTYTSRIGYLARVREASFLTPDLPTDTPLRVSAHLEGAAPPLAIYRIRVSVNGTDVLSAILSTHSGVR